MQAEVGPFVDVADDQPVCVGAAIQQPGNDLLRGRAGFGVHHQGNARLAAGRRGRLPKCGRELSRDPPGTRS